MVAPQFTFKASDVQPLHARATNFLEHQRSLLWGGSLAIALGVGYGLAHLPGAMGLLGWAGFGSVALWSLRTVGHRARPSLDLASVTLTPEQVHQSIQQTRLQLEHLIAESSDGDVPPDYGAELNAIERSLTRTQLVAQIVGSAGVGKTTLQQHWREQSPLFHGQWQMAADPMDLTELSSETITLQKVDVVLFMVQGDLTQPEWVALQHLSAQYKRLVLLLNKQDQYLPAQVELVLAQIKQRLSGLKVTADGMAIATQPQPFKVRQHQADGTYQDRWETPQPQLQPLWAHLHQMATQERSQLVLRRAYQQSLAVQTQIQTALNQRRRDRALPLIERYQWIAAGTAFANPLPSLDLVAAAAITGKMIQELAQIYGIPLSLERAAEMAGVLAKMLIQMGLVEASTQLLMPLLKGNAVTFVAGGCIQGVGAAYFTRIAGLSLVELFEVYPVAETPWQLNRTALGQIVQRLFSQHQKLGVFQDLVQQTLGRLGSPGTAAIATP